MGTLNNVSSRYVFSYVMCSLISTAHALFMRRNRGFMPKNEVPCRTLVITNYKRAQLYHHFPLYLLKKFQV